MNINRIRIFLLSGLVAVQVYSEPTDHVAALRGLTIESGTIQSVESVDQRTMVKILLNPAKGSNIKVELCLPPPQKWNGRLIGLGNGGAAGHINPAGLMAYCAQGFAAVTTDMGTAPNPNFGVGNPEVWKDFGFRATHLMTTVAKQVVKVYYGKAQTYAYFNGGSTGGQQALQEAQRYPEDYDGIVANIPAHCRTPLHAYFLWNDQILKKCTFTPSQKANIEHAGNAYMAARQVPALAGRCAADPRYTRTDIEAVIRWARKDDPTLTEAHAEALYKLFDGPRHTVTGERIFNGIPFGSSFDAAHGHLYLFAWAFENKKATDEINFGEDIDTYTRLLGPYLNAENPDLSAFAKRGGKLIAVSGSADSIVPYSATLDYYERVIARFGGVEQVRGFFRYYIVPGMGHGGQATGLGGFNALSMVMDWREQGIAPDSVICRRVVNGKTEIEMPIYPYPQQPLWDAKTKSYQPVEGPRGGVESVAERFRPAAKE